MIYLLYGTEKYLIDKYIKKIKLENNIDEFNLSIYNLETDLKNIIEDANTLTMFGNKKMIIVNDENVFSGMKLEIDVEPLINYLNNLNPNTIIVFINNSDKINERKKITKILKEIGTISDFNSFDNSYLKEMFKDYNIDNFTINLLKERVGNDLERLSQEINKIIIYKDKEKNITKEDIINLTCENTDTNIFDLIESIVSKDKEKAIQIYNNMIKINEEPIKIITMLANQFRIIYQVKNLYKMGYTEKDIASILDIHPYRIKLALQKANNYSNEILLKNLYSLAELDCDIKTGRKDKYTSLELFLISV